MRNIIRILFLVIPIISFSQKISLVLDDSLVHIILSTHNKYRAEVGVENLVWSDSLALEAQDWANKLTKQKCKIKHSYKKGIGENIFWSSRSLNPKIAVDSWAGEKKYYKYGKCCNNKTLHYTQIIWGKTKKVGCAKSICKDGAEIWICNYSPQGNYIGEKPFKKQ